MNLNRRVIFKRNYIGEERKRTQKGRERGDRRNIEVKGKVEEEREEERRVEEEREGKWRGRVYLLRQ